MISAGRCNCPACVEAQQDAERELSLERELNALRDLRALVLRTDEKIGQGVPNFYPEWLDVVAAARKAVLR